MKKTVKPHHYYGSIILDWFTIGYKVLGGLGIFFFGMKLLSEGLQSISSRMIRKVINSLTTNRFMAVIVGMIVTMIVQSSSVSTVMTVGFVNAGLMNLTQAIGVIFGANIGTTITGWVIAIKVTKYSLLFIGLGIIPMLFLKNETLSSWGKVLFAIGLVFLGLSTMSGAFKPLRTYPEFISFLSYFDSKTYLSLIGTIGIGCLLTCIVQSSSAMLGITIALAMAGTIEFTTAAALVMGENIGTTITAILAGIGTNTNARRASYAHAIFNVCGVVVMTFIFAWYVGFIEELIPGLADFTEADGSKPNIAWHISASHTIFNVVNVIIFLPLMGLIVKIVTRLAPDTDNLKQPKHLSYLGTKETISPAIAIVQARQELEKFSELVTKMLIWSREYIENPDAKKANKTRKRVLKYESITDSIHQELITFLATIMTAQMNSEEAQKIEKFLKISDELESLGDYCQKLVQKVKWLHDKNEFFDKETHKSILKLNDEATEFYEAIKANFIAGDATKVDFIKSSKKSFNEKARAVRNDYLKRVRELKLPPLISLSVADVVAELGRIFSHSRNIAELDTGVYSDDD